MRELAKKRLQSNFQQSAKYLALVFNDFFVLALIFIFGAVMFWYAQVMKVLPVKAWYYPLVLSRPALAGLLARQTGDFIADG